MDGGFLDWVWKEAATLGNLAQVVTALIAGGALGFAYAQIHSGKGAQREATLDELNRDQNRLSIEHPRFANPALAELNVEARMFDDSLEKFEQYTWFVVIGLIVCERALRYKNTKIWRDVTDDFLSTHSQLLASSAFEKHWPLYDDRLRSAWKQLQRRLIPTAKT